jgi:two-component sensor histidine kinase
MAMHELTANAMKYGALSDDRGRIIVEWGGQTDARGERLVLEWRESGGPPVVPPARRGFGSRLIERGLASELGGEVSLRFDPDGLVCRIDAPMAAFRFEA